MDKIKNWHWIILLVAVHILMDTLPISEGGDLYALLLTSLVLIYIQSEPIFQANPSKHLSLGIGIYWFALLFDYFDKLVPPPWAEPLDILDGLLLTIGFYFIGLAFVNATRTQKQLITEYQNEIQRSNQLKIELERQANTDELTGLGNRRALFYTLKQKLEAGETGTLLYIDVNNFKPVNDRFGHETGDLVLKRCADKFKSAGAVAFRIGGDEFVILLSHEDPKLWALNLCRSATDLAQDYDISLSIGLAPFSPHNPTTPDALLEQADKDMYSEKQSSRRRQENRR
ncbi:GGDEF domain-containing protein [Chitinibacter sp. SCUT-21]|uniref:GGDEF domain-containing protein n=1 Tax=Chitinibacter sp. SCUT-21 TaxID=2970891 RepID=UPI0035A67C80